ncbi:hypothetical protein BH23GEM2_BH23GEM2_25530 [soil metagenome]
MRSGILVMFLLSLVACAQQPAGSDPSASEPGVMPAEDQQEWDWAEIERLENEAKALARATGCTSSEGCRTAPVGNRACGGPRYYLVYCAAATDSTALFSKLNEVVNAENEYNEEYEMVSTCEFRMPPDIAFSGGECRPATEQRSTP